MTDRSHRMPPGMPLATPQEVAEYRRTTVAALAQERYRGEGPPYIKAGRRILYDWNGLREWLSANTVGAA